MIDVKQLEQLLAFAEYGTVSKAAEELLISQPALTRSLQRLEEDLEIPIFNRQKNKMTLTETGLYTVDQARSLLAQSQQFLETIQRHHLTHGSLSIGSCALGPSYEIKDRLKEAGSKKELHFHLENEEKLLSTLLDETYQMVITEAPLAHDQVLTRPFLKEQLYLTVPNHHELAHKSELTNKDLEGLTMLLFDNVGSAWDKRSSGLTKTNFILQENMGAFADLISSFTIPYFSTNITQLYFPTPSNRSSIPLVDPQMTISFHVNVLRKNKDLLDL